jgi:hypothetical protein
MPGGNFAFLVVGAGRGGTSLVAALLDAHDRLEVGFELFSEGYLMGVALAASGPRIFDERAGAFVQACRDEAARHPATPWGNKITTEHVAGLEDHNAANPFARIDVLDRFFNECLAGVKIVFVLRDGRTCVRSKVRRTGQSVAEACARWRYSVDVWRFLATRHAKNIRIRYEDVVREPVGTLSAVCAFLDVPFEPAMLRGTDSAKLRPEYRRQALDLSALDLAGVPDGCIERIRTELALCGYA